MSSTQPTRFTGSVLKRSAGDPTASITSRIASDVGSGDTAAPSNASSTPSSSAALLISRNESTKRSMVETRVFSGCGVHEPAGFRLPGRT